MILVLFLISIAVLELILWKASRSEARRSPEEPGNISTAECATKNLLDLASAIENERQFVDSTMVESIAEYNREDAGVE